MKVSGAALQRGVPLRPIPQVTIQDILRIKAQLGWPDARFESQPVDSQFEFPIPLRGHAVALHHDSEVEVLTRNITAVGARLKFSNDVLNGTSARPSDAEV